MYGDGNDYDRRNFNKDKGNRDGRRNGKRDKNRNKIQKQKCLIQWSMKIWL